MLQWLLRGPGLLVSAVVLVVAGWVTLMYMPDGIDESPRQEPTRIYFVDNISFAHREIIRRFNEKFRGRIEVVPIDVPFTKFSTNERKQLLTRSLRSKSARVDVFAVDLVWVPRFAKWAEPLTPAFPPTVREQFLPYALESCIMDGELLALPLYLDIGVLYYRRDILRRLPDFQRVESKLQRSMTWREFLGLRSRLGIRQGRFYLYPADSYEGLMCGFVELVRSRGGRLVRNGSLSLTAGQALSSLQFLVDLVHRFHATPPAVTTFKENEVYRFALENDVPFFRGWPGNLEEYRDEFPDKVANMGVAALPHFADGKPAATYGGWNLMISRDSERKAEALEFLRFATSREIQKILYEKIGYLPANRQVYSDSAFVAAHPEILYMKKLFEMGVHRPMLSDYTKFSDIVSYFIHQAIRGEITPQEALTAAERRIRSRKVLIN